MSNALEIGGPGPTVNFVNLGSAAPAIPFQLGAVEETDDSYSITVSASTVGGQLPSDMSGTNDPIFKLTGVTGDGVVYIKVTFAKATGVISQRQILKASSLPEDTDTEAHFPLGYFATGDDGLVVNNTAYGPVGAQACRDFFVEEATYHINFSAAAVNVLGS